MKRTLALAVVALILLPGAARADSRDFNFCGGSYTGYTGFAFCASVKVGLAPSAFNPGAYTVTLDIMNRSGRDGSYAGSLFANIGLENVIPDAQLASTPNLYVKQRNTVTGVYDVVCSNVNNSPAGNADCWNVGMDKSSGGGLKIDLLANT